jgi:hypothetical protein
MFCSAAPRLKKRSGKRLAKWKVLVDCQRARLHVVARQREAGVGVGPVRIDVEVLRAAALFGARALGGDEDRPCPLRVGRCGQGVLARLIAEQHKDVAGAKVRPGPRLPFRPGRAKRLEVAEETDVAGLPGFDRAQVALEVADDLGVGSRCLGQPRTRLADVGDLSATDCLQRVPHDGEEPTGVLLAIDRLGAQLGLERQAGSAMESPSARIEVDAQVHGELLVLPPAGAAQLGDVGPLADGDGRRCRGDQTLSIGTHDEPAEGLGIAVRRPAGCCGKGTIVETDAP